MDAEGILLIIPGDRVAFWCPGCEDWHQVKVPPGAHAWGFNGNYDAPTFTPSVLVQGTKMLTDEQYARCMAGERVELTPFRCHSFVTDGNIQFLGDCTHGLAGRTVRLERKELFDITDASNRYERCPVCRRDFGMGLTTKAEQRFVMCESCGHEGPGFPAEFEDADKLAFDGWNEHSRESSQ